MVILTSLLLAALPHAVSTNDIVEAVDISGVTISPDGRWVAYRTSSPSIASNKVTIEWHIAPAKGGAERGIAKGGTALFDFAGGIEERAPIWDRDSQGFHFLAMRDGAVGIWSWRVGQEPELETRDAADVVDFRLSDDGRALVYQVGATREAILTAEQRAYDEGLLVDASVDLTQPIAGGALVGGRRVMQRLPGPWFERARLLWDTPLTEKSVPLSLNQTGTASSIKIERVEKQGKIVRGPAGATAEIFVADGKPSVVVTRGDGKRIICNVPVCASHHLRALAWRPKHDMLVMFERERGSREQIWLWRIGAANVNLLATTNGALQSPLKPPRCDVGVDYLACAIEAAVEPPRLVRFDYEDHANTILADPNATLRAKITTESEPLLWHDKSGVAFSGYLLRPKGEIRPLPLVIQYYHCDGFLKGGVGNEIPMLPLTEAGIAVLCIDKARPPDDGKTEAEYALALAGIDTIIDDLGRRGLIDPAHVGIGGLSFGSEVAFWAVRHSRRFAAASLSSGQLSPYYYWANALPDRGVPAMLEKWWGLGDPDHDKEGWQKLSATSDVDAIDTPLLLQLPEAEARYMVELHTKLKRAGKPVDLYAFADEPHMKTQPRHKQAVYTRNLDWYRFWLTGEVDRNPAKAAQYKRWQSYCRAPNERIERAQRSISAICNKRM